MSSRFRKTVDGIGNSVLFHYQNRQAGDVGSSTTVYMQASKNLREAVGPNDTAVYHRGWHCLPINCVGQS